MESRWNFIDFCVVVCMGALTVFMTIMWDKQTQKLEIVQAQLDSCGALRKLSNLTDRVVMDSARLLDRSGDSVLYYHWENRTAFYPFNYPKKFPDTLKITPMKRRK